MRREINGREGQTARDAPLSKRPCLRWHGSVLKAHTGAFFWTYTRERFSVQEGTETRTQPQPQPRPQQQQHHTTSRNNTPPHTLHTLFTCLSLSLSSQLALLTCVCLLSSLSLFSHVSLSLFISFFSSLSLFLTLSCLSLFCLPLTQEEKRKMRICNDNFFGRNWWPGGWSAVQVWSLSSHRGHVAGGHFGPRVFYPFFSRLPFPSHRAHFSFGAEAFHCVPHLGCFHARAHIPTADVSGIDKFRKDFARKHSLPATWSLNSLTSEPSTLMEDQFDEHWRDVIVTFVKEGLESRCGQVCKKSQDLILKFSLLTIHVKLTRSQKRKRSRNSIDHESSDAVKPKQLRDQMV